MPEPRPARVGIVGTGFIARQLARALARSGDLTVGAVLTRRPLASVADFPAPGAVTHALPQLLAQADVIAECSGDPRQACRVTAAAFDHGLPVVTMNTEFHVTCGAHFTGRGYLTEAEGDQPGALAALAREAVAMGFEPLVYGNLKGYLEHDPAPEAMQLWARRLGISLPQVTAFTDGSKLQMEQALVANGLGAGIAQRGLLGLDAGADRAAAQRALGERALALGRPIADYLLGAGLPPGVFLTARHDAAEQVALRHYKLGEGPLYVLERPYHLCALEMPRTLRAALRGEPPLLHNGARPAVSVAAIAKRDLPRGQRIARGLGGFELRGEAVLAAEHPGHAPLGALFDAVLRHPVPRGALLGWADIEQPDNPAADLARRLFP